jgi:cyclase
MKDHGSQALVSVEREGALQGRLPHGTWIPLIRQNGQPGQPSPTIGYIMAQGPLPDIVVTRIDDHLTKLWVNDYVNVIALRCGGETMLFDSGFQETAAQVASKLEELGLTGITHLINTHADRDHTGGNALLGREGVIVSHANCRKSLAETDGFPPEGLPTVTFTDSLHLECGDHEVVLTGMAGGHTNGDILIYLPDSNTVHLGDIIIPDSFPVVWLEYGEGVDVRRLSEILERLIGMFPEGVRFLSGHGRDYTVEDLRRYHDMVRRTIGLVRRAAEGGRTVEHMKEEDLLGEWKTWNHPQFDWINADFWMDTVYRCLRG